MSAPTGFIPNVIDRNGRPLFVPEGQPLPDGAVQVAPDIYARIVAGDSRCYSKASGAGTCVHGSGVWAPSYSPGPGWTEVTDPAELAALRARLSGAGMDSAPEGE